MNLEFQRNCKTIGERIALVLFLFILPAAVLADSPDTQSQAKPVPVASQNGTMIPAGLMQMPSTSKYYSPYAFVVDKTSRTLSVWQRTETGLKQVAAFPADMGKNTGDKKHRDDARTPEGIYFLKTRLDAEAIDFSLYGKRAFTTDYPNFFDRREGKTGSGIWLHAVPDHVALTRGSKGCVVVRNNVILELTPYVTIGKTPLLIQNSTELVDNATMEKRVSGLTQWLENWRAAWEKKDLDSYISAYGDEFRSQHMNKLAWRKHKAELAAQYEKIQVQISRPSIYADRDRLIVRFLQEYTSDQHKDFGEKVLYLKRAGNDSFKIIGEDWNEETSEIAREEIRATTGSSGAMNASSSGAAEVANGRAAASSPQ